MVVGPGRLYSFQNVDNSAYSSLPLNTTNQILKQGINLSSVTLGCPAPATSGQSINYLVEVGFQESDTGLATLAYYDAANPSLPYSGPGNTGAQNATARQDLVAVQVKAGTPATTGTQTTPAPDAGFIGLFVVTVAQGQTTITASSIATQSYAPLIGSGVLPGAGNLVTPASSPVVGVYADTLAVYTNASDASFTYDLPPLASITPGWRSPFFATTQAGVITLAPSGSDVIGTKSGGSSLACSSAIGNTIRLRAASKWLIESQVGTWS